MNGKGAVTKNNAWTKRVQAGDEKAHSFPAWIYLNFNMNLGFTKSTHLKISMFVFLIFYFTFFIFTPLALAQPAGFGLEETAAAGGLITDAANPPAFGPATVAGKIVGYLLAFVGVIFFALMIWGGILWMTARGNDEQIKKAQDLIKSAIIGILIVFMSYVLTRFVITRLTQGLR